MDPLVGSRIKLRLYRPGEGTIGFATGKIISREPKESEVKFHDGFVIRLENAIKIKDSEVLEAYIVPSGSYVFVPDKDKMEDIFHEPVRTTFSWKTPNGKWTSTGDKGVFAEVSLLNEG